MTENLRDVLVEALIKGKGYTREAADHTVIEIMDQADGYALLADAVNDLLIRSVDDQNLWDGDDDQVTILCEFLAWMPDLIEHRAAERIRAMYPGHSQSEQGYRRREAADTIDPFEQVPDGRGGLCWLRKRDSYPVPERVAKL